MNCIDICLTKQNVRCKVHVVKYLAFFTVFRVTFDANLPSQKLYSKLGFFLPEYYNQQKKNILTTILQLRAISSVMHSIDLGRNLQTSIIYIYRMWLVPVSQSVGSNDLYPSPWKIFLEQPRVYPAIPILISRERGIDEKQKYKNVHFKVTLQVVYKSGHYRKLFSLFKLNNMAAPFNDLFLRSRYNSTNQIKMFMFPFEHPTNFVCQQLAILNVSRCFCVRKISPHVNDVTTPFMTSENISHLANQQSKLKIWRKLTSGTMQYLSFGFSPRLKTKYSMSISSSLQAIQN